MSLRRPAVLALAAALATAPLAASDAPQPIALASTDWQPYIGQDLPEHGYVHQLVQQAFRRAGYEARIAFYPWARALALAREGKVAGLVPEYFDASRTTEFAYSDPFPGGPLGFYARRDRRIRLPAALASDPDAALRSLQHLRFGVVRGYLNTPEFDAAGYLDKDVAKDDLINLRKLYYGRVDLVVIDRHVAAHLLRTALPEYAAALEFLEPPLAEHPLYVAFPRRDAQHAEHLAAFNRGLAALRASGELKRLRHAAGFD